MHVTDVWELVHTDAEAEIFLFAPPRYLRTESYHGDVSHASLIKRAVEDGYDPDICWRGYWAPRKNLLALYSKGISGSGRPPSRSTIRTISSLLGARNADVEIIERRKGSNPDTDTVAKLLSEDTILTEDEILYESVMQELKKYPRRFAKWVKKRWKRLKKWMKKYWLESILVLIYLLYIIFIIYRFQQLSKAQKEYREYCGGTHQQAKEKADAYYDILGVRKGAPFSEIKKAYRKKAKEHNPDRNPNDPKATEKMRKINEAYEFFEAIIGRKGAA